MTSRTAITTTSADYAQPAVGATVAVQVADSSEFDLGEVLFVVGGGWYTVSAKADATHATLTNLGYTGSAAVGATVASGAAVCLGAARANIADSSAEVLSGATVPVAGALTTGNVLQVTGASALEYAPVNLAGGADYVTGLLPEANFAVRTGSICSGSSNPICIIANRATLQSPINNAKAGVVNFGSRSSGATVGATGDYTTILGGDLNVASADYATVCGGVSNVASAGVAFIGGGNSNTANGTYGCVVGGLNNTSSGTSSCVGGGESNTANTGTHCNVGGGKLNAATGQYACIPGGFTNAASGVASIAMGQYAVARHVAEMAHGASTVGAGQAQFTRTVLYGTSDATPTAVSLLTSSGVEYVVTANVTYLMRISVVGSTAANAAVAGWTFNALVKSTGTIGSMSLVYTKQYDIPGTFVEPVISAVGSTVRISCNGAAGAITHFVATIEATEVLFA